MDKASYVYMLVEAVVFLVPVGTLVWRMAKLSAKVERHEDEINDIKTSVSDKIDTLTNLVNNLTVQVVELKTEIRVSKEK